MKNKDAKLLVQSAILELMKEKEFSKISIMDIIHHAGICRSTYYYHYYQQEEIIDDIIEDFLMKNEEMIEKTASTGLSLPSTLVSGVDLFFEHREMLKIILSSKLEHNFEKKFYEHWRSDCEKWGDVLDSPNHYKRYIDDYMFFGLYNIYKRWILGDCTESTEMIAELLEECCEKFI